MKIQEQTSTYTAREVYDNFDNRNFREKDFKVYGSPQEASFKIKELAEKYNCNTHVNTKQVTSDTGEIYCNNNYTIFRLHEVVIIYMKKDNFDYSSYFG